MKEQVLEIEAESLEEARELLKSKIPKRLQLLSEEIIADGKPKTTQARADTTKAAFTKAQDQVPSNAEIQGERELISPVREVIAVEAFDEQTARSNAEFEARKQFGGDAVLYNFRLAVAGSKGFLGVGKKPSQYEAEIVRQAVVEITHKTKAKISAKVGINIEVLIGDLKSDDEKLRTTAIEALRKTGWDEWAGFGAAIVDSLVGALNGELESRKKPRLHFFSNKSILSALGQLGTLIEDTSLRARIVDSLIAAFKNRHQLEEEREPAVEALGRIAQHVEDTMLRAEVIALLEAAFKDVMTPVHKAAAKALEQIGMRVEIDELALLRQHLLSKNYYIRSIARERALGLADRGSNLSLERAFQASEKLQGAGKEQNRALENDLPMDLCQEAIRLEPSFSAAYAYLSYLYRWYRKEYNLALEWVQKALEADPDNEYAWIELGRIHVALKDVVAATEAFRKAIALNPDVYDVEPYLRLVNVYERLNLWDEGLQASERIQSAGVGLDHSEADAWSRMVMRANLARLGEAMGITIPRIQDIHAMSKIMGIYVMTCGVGPSNRELHYEVSRMGWQILKESNPACAVLYEQAKGDKTKVYEGYQQLSATKDIDAIIVHFRRWIVQKVGLIVESVWETNFFHTPIHDPAENRYMLVYFHQLPL